ncbi:MAG: hypothetical protein Q7R79_00200 [bacterium]|nr:hypothetical protein [bacterium]
MQEGSSDWINAPLGYFADAYRSMRSGSAMAPFLAMSFLAGVFGVPCLLFGNTNAQVFAIVLMACAFGATIVKGFYFMKYDPWQLRTDQHSQRMRALDIFGDKDNPLHAEADHVISLISNPSLTEALPPAKETHD